MLVIFKNKSQGLICNLHSWQVSLHMGMVLLTEI